MKRFAILVAGGKGNRMQSDTPKQFLPLRGEPVIVHTVRRFLKFDPNIAMVVVLPEEHMATGKSIIDRHFEVHRSKMDFCVGGTTRFQSVKSGLSLVGHSGVVAVHDAVRPLVSADEIAATFELAAKEGSGILATEVKESLRRLEGDQSVAVSRALYRSVQTPQTFDADLLKKAYQQQEIPEFTDDASVFERAGHTIHLVAGSYRNIKLTTPEDLVVAEVLLK